LSTPYPTGISARAPPFPSRRPKRSAFQLVNGWNNVSKNNGGVTGAFTSAYVKPKYTWDLNYYVGPENNNTAFGVRQLIDTTLLLTPNAKFNAYINYDFGSNRDARENAGDNILNTWQGVALCRTRTDFSQAGPDGQV